MPRMVFEQWSEMLKNNVCALCLATSVRLLESHIIPEFMIKDAVQWLPRGKKGTPQPFIEEVKYDTLEVARSGLKKRFLYAEGIIQPFLCAACEEHLHKGENYVRKTLYGTGPKKVHARCQRQHLIYRPGPNGRSIIRGVEWRDVEYRLFKQFQLGVAWRCCAAGGKAFDKIAAPADLLELMRAAIFSDNPSPRLVPCYMEKMAGFPSVWLESLALPQIHNGTLVIIMGGYQWHFYLEAAHRGFITLMQDGRLITQVSNSGLHENLPK